ncbi:uncharacterized protein LOC131842997 [Achroia grisella]|uniref:uncharacterized protein LOC131842997 n=1 Tax=Achroia grisella TaxID=688607 RepID=UPI0027D27D1B|nr:uncharacterized protein LOC131842997 [Achroia grisella]
MSTKKSTTRKTKLLAKLVTKEKGPCAFCHENVDDELIYGKLYIIGGIKCHYFCVLLSCCLMQKGKDEEGLFGFLYPDILAELERSKKHKCSYCGRDGATLGCSVGQCRKQFHLPCGRRKNAVSLFFGTYKSYCQIHAPKQSVAANIMVNAKMRMKKSKNKEQTAISDKSNADVSISEETVCVICYEEVDGYPSTETFWPPCCARDAWFHRTCLQRMALSAGMHYLKCPLCNDKDDFYKAVVGQGYYVPDRDAAWELEQNAFAEIYEREAACDAVSCYCRRGRLHDSDGPWDIILCILCGSSGIHLHCLNLDCDADSTGVNVDSNGRSSDSAGNSLDSTGIISDSIGKTSDIAGSSVSTGRRLDSTGRSNDFTSGTRVHPERYVCRVCRPAAPADLDQLANNIAAVVLSERAPVPANLPRPLMRSRMSLRRTKGVRAGCSSTSKDTAEIKTEIDVKDSKRDTASSRQELNLKAPRRRLVEATVLKNIGIKSPGKLLEYSLKEVTRQSDIVIDAALLDTVRLKFKKPKPLCVKKRIVIDIIENILSAPIKDAKNKEPVKEWCSPKKLTDVTCDNVKVEQENTSPFKLEFNLEKTPTKTTPKKVPPITIEEDTQDGITTPTKPECLNVDDSSSSTFQLPPEFIADHNSDDSLQTPKLETKTVDIQKDSSLEISENNEVVNIDVIKMEDSSPNFDFIKNLNIKSPEKTKKCAFKFSPIDKESLQTANVDIDVESFKNQYLNEVGRDFKCKFKHNHSDIDNSDRKLRTPIDFALEANRKRKLQTKRKSMKRKKVSKDKYVECNLKYKERDADIELSNDNSNLKVSLASERRKKKIKKSTKLSINNKNIRVKIRWRKQYFKLKISDSKKRKEKISPKSLKQYVLNYKEGSSKEVLEKPVHDITPVKRKRKKQEKTPDHMKQTSIQNFFKLVPKTE